MPKRGIEGEDSDAKRVKEGAAGCKDSWEDLKYMSGFGNEFASEALPGALPKAQNSPQIIWQCAYGLYAEQLSGTAFTVPRSHNQRSWLYRIRPAVLHTALVPMEHAGLAKDLGALKLDPNQMRWTPRPIPEAPTTFLDGLVTMAAADGMLSVHLYACNTPMGRTAFYNSDGDMLIVPQEGTLHVRTEFGRMVVAPHEICVVQRGIRFAVDVSGPSRGYICEILRGHFEIPSLGPIGANGLANPRDFLTPTAWYEDDDDGGWTIVNKFGHHMFRASQEHSPFDVVAWHGNYAPYKYNLDDFVCMNSVTVDHPDPSIYTVLTCQSDTPGVAVADFVIFPPRWMVMHRSFRPPYYHRNVMTEYMGMVYGKYDAKVGFVPGGSSLHSVATPHGPDAPTFKKSSIEELKPFWFDGGLAFMFETSAILRLTDYALSGPERDVHYQKCWRALPKVFDPTTPVVSAETLATKSDAAAAAAAAAASSSSSSSTGAAAAAAAASSST